MDPNAKVTRDGTPMDHPHKYRRPIGRLIYLTITRPEMYFTVQVLSQFMSSPTIEHM